MTGVTPSASQTYWQALYLLVVVNPNGHLQTVYNVHKVSPSVEGDTVIGDGIFNYG